MKHHRSIRPTRFLITVIAGLMAVMLVVPALQDNLWAQVPPQQFLQKGDAQLDKKAAQPRPATRVDVSDQAAAAVVREVQDAQRAQMSTQQQLDELRKSVATLQQQIEKLTEKVDALGGRNAPQRR